MSTLTIKVEATPQVWQLIQDTIGEAERRGHDGITSLHLLYAATYGKGLQSLNIDVDKLKRLLERKFMTFPNSLKLGNKSVISSDLRAILEGLETYVIKNELSQITMEMLINYIRSPKLDTGQMLMMAGATDPSIESVFNMMEENQSKSASRESEAYKPKIFDIKSKNQPEQTEKKWIQEFTIDMTAKAKKGDYDAVVERDYEVDEVIDVLLRRFKNNPLLVGEPGVGKTALIEGLALKLHEGKVPTFKDTRLLQLDLVKMLSGAKYRGDFEERLQGVLDEVQSLGNVILFLEEAKILGQSNGDGGMSAGTLLKPALTKGLVRIIATITPDDAKATLEKDKTLNRCFQIIDVKEPNIDAATRMVSAVANRYAQYHGVSIESDVYAQAVLYAKRYFTYRKLPDSALDLIDYACAMSRADDIKKITNTELALATSRRSGIPVEKLSQSERNKYLELENILSVRVINQEEPVKKVADALRRNRTGLSDPNRPMGCFLFLGPTGVGKTELAKTLALTLFDDEKALIRFDMSEYMEEHSASKLIGAPPGYVGYESGGLLTEAIRRKPYSVVLFDEVEKASSQVLNIFLQMFEDGRITDGLGATVDCTNVIVIMTSNLGAAEIAQAADDNAAKEAAINAARRYLSPELFNRLDGVQVFKRLDRESVMRILKKRIIPELETRLYKTCGLSLKMDELSYTYLLAKGFDPMLGARPIKRIVQDDMESPIAKLLLQHESLVDLQSINVTLVDNKLNFELGNEKIKNKKSA